MDCCFGWLYKWPKNKPVCFDSFFGLRSTSLIIDVLDCEGRRLIGSAFNLSSFGTCLESLCCFWFSFAGPGCNFVAISDVLACALRACFSAFASFFFSAADNSFGTSMLSLFVTTCELGWGCCSVTIDVGATSADPAGSPADMALSCSLQKQFLVENLTRPVGVDCDGNFRGGGD